MLPSFQTNDATIVVSQSSRVLQKITVDPVDPVASPNKRQHPFAYSPLGTPSMFATTNQSKIMPAVPHVQPGQGHYCIQTASTTSATEPTPASRSHSTFDSSSAQALCKQSSSPQHISLETIRAGLGLPAARNQEPSPSLLEHPFSAHVWPTEIPQQTSCTPRTPTAKSTDTVNTSLAPSSSVVLKQPFNCPLTRPESATQSLLNLCEELLELTVLLEANRLEAAKESFEKAEVVRQFENLYDSLRERNAQFFRKAVEHQRRFRIIEGKFDSLRTRATTHLEEWQTARDHFLTEATIINKKCEDLQKCLTNSKALIAEQKRAISELRQGAENMPSEKEITQLNLRLRNLQNQASQLLTDKTLLKLRLEELNTAVSTARLNKGLSLEYSGGSDPQHVSKTLSIAGIRTSTLHTCDALGESRGPSFSPDTDETMTTLQRKLDKLQQASIKQEADFQKEMLSIRRQQQEYEKYKTALQNMLASNNTRSQVHSPEQSCHDARHTE